MPEYYLPDLIKSKYIPTFARICENNNDVILQKILVNSDIDVVEAIRTDNWNGGQYFHEVVLTLPEKLYFEIFKKKDDYEKTSTGGSIGLGIFLGLFLGFLGFIIACISNGSKESCSDCDQRG